MAQNTPAVLGPVQSSVRLPAEISPDGREVWDWAARFSDRVHTGRDSAAWQASAQRPQHLRELHGLDD